MKLLAALLLVSPSLFAALPPAWQGVKELEAILQDQALSRHLDSGDYIEGINRTETGWAITTNHGHVKIDVTPLPQDMPGPIKFKLDFTSQRNK